MDRWSRGVAGRSSLGCRNSRRTARLTPLLLHASTSRPSGCTSAECPCPLQRAPADVSQRPRSGCCSSSSKGAPALDGVPDDLSSRRRLRVRSAIAVATAVLLVACSASPTDSASSGAATATPEQVSLTPSPSPTPVASVTAAPTRRPDQPAVAGTDIDQVVAVLVDHDLVCERDRTPAGPHPPPDMVGAACSGPVSSGGPDLLVLVNYWQDGGISTVEGNSSGGDVQPADRVTWLRWFAEIPYEGADSAAIAAWLLSNTVEACGQGCYMVSGAAQWFHAVGLHNVDQVSFGPSP